MKQIDQAIKDNQFAGVYLLYGEEEFLKTRYRQRLVRALVAPDDTMNLTRFLEKDATEDAIISQGETMPFFAPRRVIVAENTGLFKRSADALADYLGRLPEYLVLIFQETEIDKRGRLYKAVKKYGHAAEFPVQKEEILMRWVLGELKKEQKKITRPDMEYFLSMSGTDMGNITQELEKLFSYTLGRDVITRADIDAVCTRQITNRIFDMVRAVGAHNQRRALELYEDLLSLKEQPMRILYLLAREFNVIYQVKCLSEAGQNQKEIAAKAGVPPFAVRNYMPLAKQYEKKYLESVLEAFTEAETDVKTGRLNDRLAVELMLIRYST
ncbi:MAG: DNA polymerase III subunit delta [Eubacterium sp.]|nr:DNA polymerase III subunit delta [Eubacterium sp.]